MDDLVILFSKPNTSPLVRLDKSSTLAILDLFEPIILSTQLTPKMG